MTLITFLFCCRFYAMWLHHNHISHFEFCSIIYMLLTINNVLLQLSHFLPHLLENLLLERVQVCNTCGTIWQTIQFWQLLLTSRAKPFPGWLWRLRARSITSSTTGTKLATICASFIPPGLFVLPCISLLKTWMIQYLQQS